MKTTFRPYPFLGNPHVQTVLGTLFASPARDVPSSERHLITPEGDRLLMFDSCPKKWQPGDAMTLLVHGLCGSHLSGYMARMARLLLPKGYRVVRMVLRGAGPGLRWTRNNYDAAGSGDVRRVTEEMSRLSPESQIAVVGFSLGGNLVLKMAGEAAADPIPGFAAVVAAHPPSDTAACSAMLEKPENQKYDRYFASTLVDAIRRHRLFHPDMPRYDFPKDLTLRQFDDIFTAPRAGYKNATDYYHKAASLPLIPKIRVPAFIITSRDDPFIAVEGLETLPPRPNLEVEIVPHGGHLGYIGFGGKNGFRWIDLRIANWIFDNVPVCVRPQNGNGFSSRSNPTEAAHPVGPDSHPPKRSSC